MVPRALSETLEGNEDGFEKIMPSGSGNWWRPYLEDRAAYYSRETRWLRKGFWKSRHWRMPFAPSSRFARGAAVPLKTHELLPADEIFRLIELCGGGGTLAEIVKTYAAETPYPVTLRRIAECLQMLLAKGVLETVDRVDEREEPSGLLFPDRVGFSDGYQT